MPPPMEPGSLQEPAEPAGPAGTTSGSGTDRSALPAFLRSDTAARVGGPRAIRVGAENEPSRADPAALPMAGIAPRRLVQAVAILALAWGMIAFSRQVAAATAASSHAADLRAANVALADEVAAMERELALVQERRYIAQEARAYRLGTASEIPFALEANAPALPPDAPGSAAVRLGADRTGGSPLDAWLSVLFGSAGAATGLR